MVHYFTFAGGCHDALCLSSVRAGQAINVKAVSQHGQTKERPPVSLNLMSRDPQRKETLIRHSEAREDTLKDTCRLMFMSYSDNEELFTLRGVTESHRCTFFLFLLISKQQAS